MERFSAGNEVHPLLKAHAKLYGTSPRGGFVVLRRDDLHGVLSRRGASPELIRAVERVRTQAGMSASPETVLGAAQLCLEALGDRAAVVLAPWVDERDLTTRVVFPEVNDADPVRPAPRETKPTDRESSPEAAARARPFGRFLHEKGYITLHQLVAALHWQLAQRPRVGAIAIDRGLMTPTDVVTLLKDRRDGERFLETAERAGLVSGAQSRWVLALQSARHRRIGEYFVEQGILQSEALTQLLHEHERTERDPART